MRAEPLDLLWHKECCASVSVGASHDEGLRDMQRMNATTIYLILLSLTALMVVITETLIQAPSEPQRTFKDEARTRPLAVQRVWR